MATGINAAGFFSNSFHGNCRESFSGGGAAAIQ